MEIDLEALSAHLEVQTNRNEFERSKRETAERNAAAMREALGRADV